MEKPQAVECINNVAVVDPDTGNVREHRDIHIHGGEIESVAAASKSAGPGAQDGTGLFAIPGLIDAHVHAMGIYVEEIPGPLDLPWVFRQQRKNLASFLRSGVTTVRDLGAPLKLIRDFSRRADGFKIHSPRILFSGPVLTVAGGYPYFVDNVPFLTELIAGAVRIDIKNEKHAHRVVDSLARGGVHCIKVVYQSAKYDDERTPIPTITLPLLRAIIDRAHHHGLPVAAHHIYRKDLQEIMDLPFDSLEHIAIDEPLSDQEIEQLAAKNVPVSTTLMTYGIKDHVRKLEALLREDKYRFEPKPRRFLRNACKGLRGSEQVSLYIGHDVMNTGSKHMRNTVARLSAAGVPINYGTDSGGAITPTGCPHWELLDMVRAGLTPQQALRTATVTAAHTIGRPDLGRIQPGATADIVLLRANPIEDIAAVAEVAAVIRDGRLVY